MAWHTTWNEPARRPRRSFFADRGGFFPPGVKLVLLVTIAAYVVDMLSGGRLSAWGDLSVRNILHFQVWRLFTYMFLHSLHKIDHILINMFMFLMLGMALERQMGTKRFLCLYLLGGVVGGLFEIGFNAVMYQLYGSFPVDILLPGGFHARQLVSFLDAQAVGASAGVACILVAFAVANPREEFLLFFLIPIQARWIALLYVLIETRHVVLGLTHGWTDNVAHAAHFGGMALGFLWMHFSPRIRRWGLWRKRAGRVPADAVPREDDDAEVDRILRKIHDEGIDSLTLRERMLLQDASQRHGRH